MKPPTCLICQLPMYLAVVVSPVDPQPHLSWVCVGDRTEWDQFSRENTTNPRTGRLMHGPNYYSFVPETQPCLPTAADVEPQFHDWLTLSSDIDQRVRPATAEEIEQALWYYRAIPLFVAQRYDHCCICGAELSDLQKSWTHREYRHATCSPACARIQFAREIYCCELATPKACVCAYAWTCPVHGERHVGTHE